MIYKNGVSRITLEEIKSKNFNGVICVYKPADISSNKFINKLKRKYFWKKIGHGGTLDKAAEGLLVIGINSGTKELTYFLHDKKKYIAEFIFNVETETYDFDVKDDSQIIYVDGVSLSFHELKKKLEIFLQTPYYQYPPKYSAIKYKGKSLYKYARSNQFVPALEPRLVKIYDADVIDFNWPNATFVLSVSKGFYVRSFGMDFAKTINTVATLKKLIRTEVGEFSLKHIYNI